MPKRGVMVKTTTNDALEWIAEQARRDATFRQRVDQELGAMQLEQQLVRLREARGLSQADLGRLLGISQQAVAKIESGQAGNLGVRTLMKHVLALGGRLDVAIRPREPAPRRPTTRRTTAGRRRVA